MSNVEVVESLKYGFKLFAYLLGVVVLGGGGLVLGAALAGPVLVDGSVTDELTSPELLGGVVLGLLGLTVWFTGSFGLIYKLLADAVRWGVSTEPDSPSGHEAPSEPAPHRETPESEQQTARAPRKRVGPSPGEQTARRFGPESTVPSAADVPDRAVTDGSVTTESTGDTATVESSRADDSERSPETETPRTTEKTATTGAPETDQTPDDEGVDEPAVGEGDHSDSVSTVREAKSAGTTDESAGSEERTAEEIAFGTPANPETEEHSHAESETAEPSAGDGTIPPYEAMEESDRTTEDGEDGEGSDPLSETAAEETREPDHEAETLEDREVSAESLFPEDELEGPEASDDRDIETTRWGENERQETDTETVGAESGEESNTAKGGSETSEESDGENERADEFGADSDTSTETAETTGDPLADSLDDDS